MPVPCLRAGLSLVMVSISYAMVSIFCRYGYVLLPWFVSLVLLRVVFVVACELCLCTG
jgi:hypothetical protein